MTEKGSENSLSTSLDLLLSNNNAARNESESKIISIIQSDPVTSFYECLKKIEGESKSEKF